MAIDGKNSVSGVLRDSAPEPWLGQLAASHALLQECYDPFMGCMLYDIEVTEPPLFPMAAEVILAQSPPPSAHISSAEQHGYMQYGWPTYTAVDCVVPLKWNNH
ncbi:hypothetical protein NQZ68_004957 [Dissostichus eleginoides]|nr:hypothetical protein NQZ68_004957 [Dissostichus eleginoides]